MRETQTLCSKARARAASKLKRIPKHKPFPASSHFALQFPPPRTRNLVPCQQDRALGVCWCEHLRRELRGKGGKVEREKNGRRDGIGEHIIE